MTHKQEILVLQELQRHRQALADIAAGKTTQNPEDVKEIAENEFIKQMQGMNGKEPSTEEDEGDGFVKLMIELNANKI